MPDDPDAPRPTNAWQRGRLRARLELYRRYGGKDGEPLEWLDFVWRIIEHEATRYDARREPSIEELRQRDAEWQRGAETRKSDRMKDDDDWPLTQNRLQQFMRGYQVRTAKGVRTVVERKLTDDDHEQLWRFLEAEEFIEKPDMREPELPACLPACVAAFIDDASGREPFALDELPTGEFVHRTVDDQAYHEMEVFLSRIEGVNGYRVGVERSAYDRLPGRTLESYDHDERDRQWQWADRWEGFGVLGEGWIHVHHRSADESRGAVASLVRLASEAEADVLEWVDIDPVPADATSRPEKLTLARKRLARGASVGRPVADEEL